jgi:ubiquinone/menaquinone biosynthesis C-methylase UbiE
MGYHPGRRDQTFTSFFLKILNTEASSAKNRPIEIIESLDNRKGDAIADICSGSGYFTLALAKNVGKRGRVYAVDVSQKYLDFIRRRASREGLENIICVLAKGDKIDLPEAGIDLVFARNVFHHLSAPTEYFMRHEKIFKTGRAVRCHRPQTKTRVHVCLSLQASYTGRDCHPGDGEGRLHADEVDGLPSGPIVCYL